jgi:hypothetical protein
MRVTAAHEHTCEAAVLALLPNEVVDVVVETLVLGENDYDMRPGAGTAANPFKQAIKMDQDIGGKLEQRVTLAICQEQKIFSRENDGVWRKCRRKLGEPALYCATPGGRLFGFFELLNR